MLKKISIVLACCFILLLQGCESSEIGLIKNATMNLDNSLTWGQAFDTYQFFEEPTWEVLETDRGQQIVSFKAKYRPEGFATGIKKFRILSPNVEADMIAFMNESTPIDVVADFTLSSDKKSFEMTYLGYSINGNSPTRNSALLEQDLVRLIKNEPLSLDPPQEGCQIIYNALAKAIFKNTQYNDFIFGQAFYISKSSGNDFYLYDRDNYLSNVILFKISGIGLGETFNESYIDVNFVVTDKKVRNSMTYLTAEAVNNVVPTYNAVYESTIKFYPSWNEKIVEAYNSLILSGRLEIPVESELGDKGYFVISYDNQAVFSKISRITPPQELQTLIDKEYGSK